MGIWGNTHKDDNAAILTRWNDLRIENCRFENIDGRGAQIRDSCHDITDQRKGLSNYYPTLGFVFEKNDGFNCYRNLLQLRGTKDAAGAVQYDGHHRPRQRRLAVWHRWHLGPVQRIQAFAQSGRRLLRLPFRL